MPATNQRNPAELMAETLITAFVVGPHSPSSSSIIFDWLIQMENPEKFRVRFNWNDRQHQIISNRLSLISLISSWFISSVGPRFVWNDNHNQLIDSRLSIIRFRTDLVD